MVGHFEAQSCSIRCIGYFGPVVSSPLPRGSPTFSGSMKTLRHQSPRSKISIKVMLERIICQDLTISCVCNRWLYIDIESRSQCRTASILIFLEERASACRGSGVFYSKIRRGSASILQEKPTQGCPAVPSQHGS